MISPDKLKKIHYFEHVPDPIIARLSEAAEEVSFQKGDFILRQHDEANYLYVLMSGTIQFLLRFEGVDDLIVGATSKKLSLIGWSCFRIPYRYTASVQCAEDCQLIRFPAELLNKICDDQPQFGFLFLRKIASTLADRLEATREVLFQLPQKSSGDTIEDHAIDA